MKINRDSTRKEVLDAYVQLLDNYKKLLTHCADQADQLHIVELDNARLRRML